MSRRAAAPARVGAVLAAFVAMVAVTGGCDDDHDDAIIEADGIAVLDAWVRPTPTGADEAAFYVTVENRDAPDDRLIGAASDRCMVVTPHVTEIDADDVASMSEATGGLLDLPTGGRVEMEPIGLHLMCLGLTEPLMAGDDVTAQLSFAEHEPIELTLTVEQR